MKYRKLQYEEIMELHSKRQICGYLRTFTISRDQTRLKGYCSLEEISCDSNLLPQNPCPRIENFFKLREQNG